MGKGGAGLVVFLLLNSVYETCQKITCSLRQPASHHPWVVFLYRFHMNANYGNAAPLSQRKRVLSSHAAKKVPLYQWGTLWWKLRLKSTWQPAMYHGKPQHHFKNLTWAVPIILGNVYEEQPSGLWPSAAKGVWKVACWRHESNRQKKRRIKSIVNFTLFYRFKLAYMNIKKRKDTAKSLEEKQRVTILICNIYKALVTIFPSNLYVIQPWKSLTGRCANVEDRHCLCRGYHPISRVGMAMRIEMAGFHRKLHILAREGLLFMIWGAFDAQL